MRANQSLVLTTSLLLFACVTNGQDLPASTLTPDTIAQEAQTEEGDGTPTKEENVNVTTSGTISKDETWRGEIHLTGDIGFANGATLTIEPGTVVYFASNSDDRNANDTDGCFDEYTCQADDPTLRRGWGANAILFDGRRGIINAIGTPEKPIVFRPEGDSTSPSQYGGIYIERGKLMYSKLLYGSGVQALGDVGSIEIAYNEVRYFLIAGIDVHTTDVWVHHNVVEGGGHHGIGVHQDDALVEHNTILNCQTGINLHQQSSVTLRNNIVIDCAHGIAVNGNNIVVENNTIASIAGPPEGWYYQGQLVYEPFMHGSGIIGSSEGPDRIVNNIIYGPFQWAISYHGPEPFNGAQVEFNLYWGTVEAFGGPGQSVISSNNLSLDPDFVDPNEGNFSLAPSSPAINSGSPDLLNENDTPSDLGAYGGPQGGNW